LASPRETDGAIVGWEIEVKARPLVGTIKAEAKEAMLKAKNIKMRIVGRKVSVNLGDLGGIEK
jgi:hypothetical protein